MERRRSSHFARGFYNGLRHNEGRVDRQDGILCASQVQVIRAMALLGDECDKVQIKGAMVYAPALFCDRRREARRLARV